ncbi:MAG: hypothetical protein WBP64_18610 [Nitrososphaeraceae archaeon]
MNSVDRSPIASPNPTTCRCDKTKAAGEYPLSDNCRTNGSRDETFASTSSIRPAFSSAYVLVERWASSAPASLYSIKTMSGRKRVTCGFDMPRNGLDIAMTKDLKLLKYSSRYQDFKFYHTYRKMK